MRQDFGEFQVLRYLFYLVRELFSTGFSLNRSEFTVDVSPSVRYPRSGTEKLIYLDRSACRRIQQKTSEISSKSAEACEQLVLRALQTIDPSMRCCSPRSSLCLCWHAYQAGLHRGTLACLNRVLLCSDDIC